MVVTTYDRRISTARSSDSAIGRDGIFRTAALCSISTCRIGYNGLPYAARAECETEPFYVLPRGSSLDAKIDESANRVEV